MTDLEKVSYGFGINIAQNMKEQGMTEIDTKTLAQGMQDYLSGSELQIPEDQVQVLLQEFFKKLQDKQFGKNIEAGAAFFAENKNKEGVITLESGLQYEILTAGDGAIPKAENEVTTHYHGTLLDGTVFDSSVDRGEPATFPVGGVIKGWVEALQLMPVGSKWKLYVPSELAYGPSPHPGGPIEPHMALVFEIELLSIA